MCVKRLAVCVAVFGAALLALTDSPAWPQGRTVKLIVPYPPASGPDILSRLMAEQMARMQSATLVIENRPGGGTLIGTEAAARAAPDGNTVLFIANSFVT